MPIDPASLAGQAAVYKVIGSGTGLNVVSQIMLILLGTDPAGPDAGYWMQLQITKIDGQQLVASVLLDEPVLSRERADDARVRRYVYQEGNARPIEYVNAVRGGAVTTTFGLLRNFFPTFDADDVADELFPARGRYLGLPIERTAVKKLDLPRAAAIPTNPLRLELDPELLIGTGRNIRDSHGGRIWTEEDYPYRRLEAADYDELIEAGMNYFPVDAVQEVLVRDRPVFYLILRHRPREFHWPEMFYRANCRGVTMFMDEPGVHVCWFLDEWPGHMRSLDHPAQVARFLEARVRETHDSQYYYGQHRLEHLLRMAPFDLGDLELFERFPVWEALEWSVYYPLKAGMPGAVHEGRYVLGAEPQLTNAEFDARIPCQADSIYLQAYALFRGAARVFDGDWGTAIYGQTEETLAPLGMTMAYDMGARYVWFWTSDHSHHMPYEEQVALTRTLRDHAKHHPRPPLQELREAAEVAIALPDGYMFGPYRLWDAEVFHLDRLNRFGVSYRDVVGQAARQVERCIKGNISFDIVYADDAFLARQDKYERVIFIREDGKVEGRRRDGSAFDVPAPPRTEAERRSRPPEIRIHAEPVEGSAPLTTTLTADVAADAGPVGLKLRETGGGGWDYLTVHWTIHLSPEEARLERTKRDEPLQVTFEEPGTYRVTAWTFNDQGVPARESVTIQAR